MIRTLLLVLLALLSGCAHLRPDSETRAREATWREGHFAFYRGDFVRAAAEFQELVTRHPESGEGREALFFLGVMSLDPRNPAWNPQPAAERLRRYLELDSITSASSFPRPEARTLLGLADQLNLPPEERVAGLQQEARVVPVPSGRPVERVVVPATESRALAAEVERLRRELDTRDATIRRQREELDRIRNTLTPRRP
jgi:hypothetical protein